VLSGIVSLHLFITVPPLGDSPFHFHHHPEFLPISERGFLSCEPLQVSHSFFIEKKHAFIDVYE